MATEPGYVLDTDLCVALLRTPLVEESPLWGRFEVARCRLSSITVAELEVGIHKAANPAKQRRLVAALLAEFEILSFDAGAARHYGQIRAHLEKRGMTIGPPPCLSRHTPAASAPRWSPPIFMSSAGCPASNATPGDNPSQILAGRPSR